MYEYQVRAVGAAQPAPGDGVRTFVPVGSGPLPDAGGRDARGGRDAAGQPVGLVLLGVAFGCVHPSPTSLSSYVLFLVVWVVVAPVVAVHAGPDAVGVALDNNGGGVCSGGGGGRCVLLALESL